MHDDPYPNRYYPRLERDPSVTAAVAEFHHDTPAWRHHSARLLLFLVVFYLVLAILFVASSGSHAASPLTAAPEVASYAGCMGTQMAVR